MVSLGNLVNLVIDVETSMAGVKMAEEIILHKACEMLLTNIRESIGTYAYGWTPLLAETVERKGADTPLLELGELRDSYTYEVDYHHREAWVGSNNPKAVWHEWGTRTIPPRPVLLGALTQCQKPIEEMAAKMLFRGMLSAFLPHEARELRELWHLIKDIGHEAKEFGEEIVREPKPNEFR